MDYASSSELKRHTPGVQFHFLRCVTTHTLSVFLHFGWKMKDVYQQFHFYKGLIQYRQETFHSVVLLVRMIFWWLWKKKKTRKVVTPFIAKFSNKRRECESLPHLRRAKGVGSRGSSNPFTFFPEGRSSRARAHTPPHAIRWKEEERVGSKSRLSEFSILSER